MESARLGGSVEAEVLALLDADETVRDETVYFVAAALHGDEELAEGRPLGVRRTFVLSADQSLWNLAG